MASPQKIIMLYCAKKRNEENEIIFGNFWADEDIELWNIPADNHKYGMIIHNGETEVYRDGKLIRKGEGKIKIKRNE